LTDNFMDGVANTLGEFGRQADDKLRYGLARHTMEQTRLLEEQNRLLAQQNKPQSQQNHPQEDEFRSGLNIFNQAQSYPYGSEMAFKSYEEAAVRGFGPGLVAYQWLCLLRGSGTTSYQSASDLFQATIIKCCNPPSTLPKEYLDRYMLFKSDAFCNHGLALISCGTKHNEAFACFEQAKIGESKMFGTVLALHLGESEKAASFFSSLSIGEKDALAASLAEDIGKCDPNGWTINWLKDCQNILPGDLTVQLECVLPVPAASSAGETEKSDASSRLINLQKLLSDGLITQTEFDQKRSQILEDL